MTRSLVGSVVLVGDGFLYVVDRKGAMIISGGYNIWPAELERVIEALPEILEAVVVPIPDDRWGETPLAVCVVRPGSGLGEADIVDACRSRLGSYKKPGRVILREAALPKTVVGKVDRKAIREPYWAGHEKRVRGA